jgi:hypothetical protein
MILMAYLREEMGSPPLALRINQHSLNARIVKLFGGFNFTEAPRSIVVLGALQRYMLSRLKFGAIRFAGKELRSIVPSLLINHKLLSHFSSFLKS